MLLSARIFCTAGDDAARSGAWVMIGLAQWSELLVAGAVTPTEQPSLPWRGYRMPPGFATARPLPACGQKSTALVRSGERAFPRAVTVERAPDPLPEGHPATHPSQGPCCRESKKSHRATASPTSDIPCSRHEDLSQASVRLGQPALAAA